MTAPALGFHRSLPRYAPTPLRELEPGVWMKDESDRMGLPAFKILGASWAIERALAERPDVDTLVCASAGNHGRAVAHEAARRGLACRVYLPHRCAPARREAIVGEGAEAVVVDGGYEDAVAAAGAAGAEPGCLELADVGAPGGPAEWVMEGYATLFAELGRDFGVALVPAGVGSLVGAAVRWGGAAIWAVEPETAACVTASRAAGRPVTIETPGTTMAGLDCAEVSAAAWPLLRDGLSGTITVSDAEAHAAMRELSERGLAIGDCGAAPLAALRKAGPFDGDVLLVATEGITNPG